MKTIINLLLNNKKVLFGGLSIIVIFAVISYGVLKIQALNATVEAREQRIENVEERYNNLNSQYDMLSNDFQEFVTQVQEDLAEQRELNRAVRTVNQEYRQRVLDLENTFLYDSNGNPRDWDNIFDENPSALEQIINERTRGLRDEFENISTDR